MGQFGKSVRKLQKFGLTRIGLFGRFCKIQQRYNNEIISTYSIFYDEYNHVKI